MTSGEILEHLYRSEINAQISWFWDNGYEWKLGSEFAGWVEEGHSPGRHFADVVRAVGKAACRHFPESEFAYQAKREGWFS